MNEEELREYEEERLHVQRDVLYKSYLSTGGEQLNFAAYMQREFPRDVFLQARVLERHEECTRGSCRMVRERKGQAFWTLEARPLTATGDVYVCADSGAMHVCTSELCRERFIPPNGYATVCRLTGRVFDDDRLLVSDGQRLGEYHMQACNSGAGYQPDNGNPILQGPSYSVFDSKKAYQREARLGDKRLAVFSKRIVKAGEYSEAAQRLNDQFLRQAAKVHARADLEALCARYEAKACPSSNDDPPFAHYTGRIMAAGKCNADSDLAVSRFLAEAGHLGLSAAPRHEAQLEELSKKYAGLAEDRATWRKYGRAVYQNEVLSSTTAQEQLLRGEAAMADFHKACKEHALARAERGLALDLRTMDDLYLEYRCGMHTRIRRRLGDLDRIDSFKKEAGEEVVALVVDIWTALHDLEATRAKTLEFRNCVLAILGYMSGSYTNFIESLSGGKYGTGRGEIVGGLRQLVKVDRETGLAHRVKSGELPPRERYDVRVVTFVPCVPGVRMGQISSGSIVYDARRASQSTVLALSESGPSGSRRAVVNPMEKHLDSIVANMKPSEKKKKNARKDVIPGFASPLNDLCTEERCVDLILAASRRTGVNAKNIQNVEQRNSAKNMIKCRQLASGAGRMTSKKNLHRIVSSLLGGSLLWEDLEQFNFVVSERLLQLHDKYRLYEADVDADADDE